MKHNFKSFVSLMLATLMILCNVPMQALAAEGDKPDATVTVMKPLTLAEGEYSVWGWNGNNLTPGTEALPLQAVLNFKANDTEEEALAGGFSKWLCDFYLSFEGLTDGKVSGAGSYLAGNYGTFGWIKIPTDDIEVENNIEYPIVANYDASLNYKDICKSVQDFTAALYINPDTLLANPDMKVTLKLKMTNPDNTDQVLVIGEPAVYTAAQLYGKHEPKATVTVEKPITLKANDYAVWAGGSDLTKGTVDLPLQAMMNFKATDTLAEAKLGGYGKWICDFYLTFDDTESDSISGVGSYLAGNYGSYGWIQIPTDTITVEKGVEYPVVSNYDDNLTYENICDYVKDFTAALYINPDTLLANPDMKVTLKLKMTNPVNTDDVRVIGEPAVFTAEQLLGYVAKNTTTKALYTDVNTANLEAAEGETVILINNAEAQLLNVLETLDLNGYTLTSQYVTSFGDIVDSSDSNSGLLKVDSENILLQSDNDQLPVYTPNGYQFVKLLGFNYRYLDTTKQYVSQPLFEEYAHELLLAGSDVSGVNTQIKVSWENAEGAQRSQNFIYNDNFVENYIKSYNPATGKYRKMFTLKLSNVNIDLNYQIQVTSDNRVAIKSPSTFVEKSEDNTEDSTEENTTTEEVTINTGDNQASAVVSQGTKLESNATADSLKLTISELDDSQSNITLSENEDQKSVDVHIEGVSKDNTVPMLITVTELAQKGLNEGNLKLYHIENGETVAMNQVFTLAEVDAHNDFYYDPATGDITMALATFSEIAVVSDTTKAWNGEFDYSWYTNAVALADGESAADYIIANADQLAAFGAIVGGMAKDEKGNAIGQDSFGGKTVKLVADVNLGDAEEKNNPDIIFYPIGYNSDDGKYEKTGKAVSTGFYAFMGTFDGNGHTISNFYHNTWEMKGDHNWYDATLQYYRDGMGLFGKVYGGTVKNLTVSNFSSDGEIATTGVIAAYADGATFENIAITNCNPRVYNIGNGGIVGCVGWYAKEAGLKTTFTNITVDNSNKISALWGSYDVACGGIVGQYYPTSGQTSAGTPKNAGIDFVNCHVSAQMDVYNDVCANYQYYAYRYTGMLIGSVRENETINGHVYPKMDGITATDCTVHFGDWNDYYYCELVANSLASYTHDHQFSRLEQVDSVDVENKTITVDGETIDIPTSGRYNYVVVSGDHATDNATCYHFVDGEVWEHEDAGTETVNGVEGVLKENNQHIYLEFNNLVTGYGWGVTSKGVGELAGVTILDREVGNSVVKFETKFTGDFLYRVGNQNTVSLGSLFKEIFDSDKTVPAVVDAGVWVTVEAVDENMTVSGTYTANTTDWTKGTIQFSGTGVVKVTIQDYNFCTPTELYLEVVDATNITSAKGTTSGGNFVLLDNVNTSSYVNYWNSTLYGNGFTYSVEGAPTAYNSSNGHGIIITTNATLDNVVFKGDVYSTYGAYSGQDCYNSVIDVTGSTTIQNCHISNCSTPIRARGDVTIKDTTLHGGTVANLVIMSGTVTVDNLTTVNYNDDAITGMGIVVHSDATDTAKLVINGELKQYNFIEEGKAPADTNAAYVYNSVFDASFEAYHFGTSPNRYANTGIISLTTNFGIADIEDNANTGYKDSDASVTIEGIKKDCFVYSQPNTNGSVDNNYVESADIHKAAVQGDYMPTFTFDLGDQTVTGEDTYLKGNKNGVEIRFFEDETPLSLDITKIATVKKYGINYTITAVCKDSSGNAIATNGVASFNETTTYTLEFTVNDNIFYDANGNLLDKTVTHTYTVPLSVTVAEPAIKDAVITVNATALNGGYNESIGDRSYKFNPLDAITITDAEGAVDLTTNISSTDIEYASGSAYAFNGDTTITVTYTDGRVLKITLEKPSLNSPGSGKDISYSNDGTIKMNGKVASKSATGGTWKVKSYSFKGTNGKTVTNNTVVTFTFRDVHTCVTGDTLVTLADGSKKRIDEVTYSDELLVWNFFEGKYDRVPSAIIFYHGNENYDVLNLKFEDGTKVKVINNHGFFDVEENKFVFIDEGNVNDYLGHSFVKVDGDSYKAVKLVGYDITTEETGCYSIQSAKYINFMVEDMFSLTIPAIDGWFDYFELGDNMKYDEEKMQADIEKYGLYTYEDFAEYVTYEQFIAFNGPYLKVLVGKGIVTYDEILELIATYVNPAE